MIETTQPLQHYFVLQNRSHGSARREDQLYGGPSHARYLNVHGHWAARGTKLIPLVAWTDHASAEAACALARNLRRGDIHTTTLGGTDNVPGQLLMLYTNEHAQVLAGQLPRERVTNVKLAAEWHRTKVFTRAVLALNEAKTPQEKADLTVHWNKVIFSAFNGGSVFSASQFLSGRRAAHIVDLLRDGSLADDEELPTSDIEQAIEIAKSDPRNQGT